MSNTVYPDRQLDFLVPLTRLHHTVLYAHTLLNNPFLTLQKYLFFDPNIFPFFIFIFWFLFPPKKQFYLLLQPKKFQTAFQRILPSHLVSDLLFIRVDDPIMCQDSNEIETQHTA